MVILIALDPADVTGIVFTSVDGTYQLILANDTMVPGPSVQP